MRQILGPLCVGVVCGSFAWAQSPASPASSASGDAAALAEAVEWIRASNKLSAQYDYTMSVKIRALLFWLSRDEVGGGYIRRRVSPNDPALHSIEVLFGSDPAKAKGINRWGAGAEVVRLADSDKREIASSAFLGFMKASKGESATAMQTELYKEKENKQFLFDATITRADRDRALARTTPFASAEDYTFRQLESASRTVMDRLDKTERPIRRSDGGGCDRPAGFLSTMQELVDEAVAGHTAPQSRCYFFNARSYTATLKSYKLVEEATTHRPTIAYRHLVRASFSVLNHSDKKTSTFDLLIPREGPWKGTPVEITYQPNFWFQIILSLSPGAAPTAAPTPER